MVFLLDSKGAKVQRCVNLVDLVKSFQTSSYFKYKFGFDTAENEPLKVCQKLARSWNKS